MVPSASAISGRHSKPGVVVAPENHHGAFLQTSLLESGHETPEGLVEVVHGVEVVAERGALPVPDIELLEVIRKPLERMMERQGQEIGAPGLGQLGQAPHRLAEKIAIVETPADLLTR